MMEYPPKDGGHAFPRPSMGDAGMSLRDWFAGQALAGICAHNDTWQLPDVPTVALQAYRIADAMLQARK